MNPFTGIFQVFYIDFKNTVLRPYHPPSPLTPTPQCSPHVLSAKSTNTKKEYDKIGQQFNVMDLSILIQRLQMITPLNHMWLEYTHADTPTYSNIL